MLIGKGGEEIAARGSGRAACARCVSALRECVEGGAGAPFLISTSRSPGSMMERGAMRPSSRRMIGSALIRSKEPTLTVLKKSKLGPVVKSPRFCTRLSDCPQTISTLCASRTSNARSKTGEARELDPSRFSLPREPSLDPADSRQAPNSLAGCETGAPRESGRPPVLPSFQQPTVQKLTQTE